MRKILPWKHLLASMCILFNSKLYSQWDVPANFPTINAAIAAAPSGSTINVAAGTYNESVVVNKPLTIKGIQAGILGKGRGGAESIVDPNVSASNGFNVVTDNVTIDGFTITNTSAYPGTERYGVVTIEKIGAGHFTNIAVKNNIITRQFKAVDFNYTDNFEISGNWLHGENDAYNYGATWVAAYGTSSSGGLMKNNDMDGYGSAIEIQGDLTHPVSNITITENRSTGSQYVLFGLQNSSIYRNSVLNVTAGTHVFVGGGNTNDVLSENFFDNGTSNGISITNFFGAGLNSNLTVTNNHITGHNNPGKYEINVDPTAYTGTLSATCNWYGTINSSAIAGMIQGPVTYTPYLTNGSDNSASAGFQPVPNSCNGYQYIDCGKKDDKKVTICHNGKPLCVSLSALQEHLNHGDQLGNCTTSRSSNPALFVVNEEIKPSVYPNPSTGLINVQVGSGSSKAEVIIMNSNGTIIERRAVTAKNLNETFQFNLRNKAAGVYTVQIITEAGVQTSKIVIQK
jgi:hypothetical protein